MDHPDRTLSSTPQEHLDDHMLAIKPVHDRIESAVLAVTAGQSIRRSAAGTEFEVFTPVLDTDARLTDQRVPTDGSVTNAKVAAGAAIDQSKLSLSIANAQVAAGAAIAQSKLSLAITNAEVATGAAIAQSKLSLAITNTEVATGAAIAQSKLSLAITNTEVAAGAAIAQSKLSLSITNAEVAAGAAIAQSKLSLSIVDANVAAGAAIAESKLALASDAAAGTASRRTLGTGALQAAAGNDARLSDARTPLAHTHAQADITNLTTDLANKADKYVGTNRQAASYTLALTDAGQVVEMNVAGANTLTVPANATVAFPVGTIIEVMQYGAGQTTIAGAGAAVLRAPGGKLKLGAQYGAVSLRKIATDEWAVEGNLVA